MKQFDENEYVIVSDFDGTITKKDSNVLLVESCGTEENAQIEADLISGLICGRDAFVKHFQALKISLQEYVDFIESIIDINAGFDEFLEITRKREIPLYIVSGGYHQAVDIILGEDRLQGIEVIANKLSGEPYITPDFASENPICNKPFGPCGNCKRDCLKKIRLMSKKKILFIGDGITDRCAAEEADLIFAKDSFARFCEEQNLPYVLYNDFFDIINQLGWTTHK